MEKCINHQQERHTQTHRHFFLRRGTGEVSCKRQITQIGNHLERCYTFLKGSSGKRLLEAPLGVPLVFQSEEPLKVTILNTIQLSCSSMLLTLACPILPLQAEDRGNACFPSSSLLQLVIPLPRPGLWLYGPVAAQTDVKPHSQNVY